MEFEAVIAVKDRKRIEPQSTLCEYWAVPWISPILGMPAVVPLYKELRRTNPSLVLEWWTGQTSKAEERCKEEQAMKWPETPSSEVSGSFL
jgi:hypothetical protein